jgi:TRAP-type C4-dicarboxylate transport system permease large subunit
MSARSPSVSLFLAGIVPGLLMMLFLMVTAWLVARKPQLCGVEGEKADRGAIWRAAWQAKWALLFPVLLIVSIRGGVFTPSEVGAFAVVYASLSARWPIAS